MDAGNVGGEIEIALRQLDVEGPHAAQPLDIRGDLTLGIADFAVNLDRGDVGFDDVETQMSAALHALRGDFDAGEDAFAEKDFGCPVADVADRGDGDRAPDKILVGRLEIAGRYLIGALKGHVGQIDLRG